MLHYTGSMDVDITSNTPVGHQGPLLIQLIILDALVFPFITSITMFTCTSIKHYVHVIYTENWELTWLQGLYWCQFCQHCQYQSSSWWQPRALPVTSIHCLHWRCRRMSLWWSLLLTMLTKLALWKLLVFYVCKIIFHFYPLNDISYFESCHLSSHSAPNHYLNQWWNIVKWTLRKKNNQIWTETYVQKMLPIKCQPIC